MTLTGRRRALKIPIIYDDTEAYLAQGFTAEDCTDMSPAVEADAIAAALTALGHEVIPIPGIKVLVEELAQHQGRHWDLVFNIGEGYYGSSREAQVPNLLEAYQIPFTFANAAVLALCQDKVLSKIALAHNGIATAPFVVIPSAASLDSNKVEIDWDRILASLPDYPIFAKPTKEGSCKGIDRRSKAKNEGELRQTVANLHSKFPEQDILLESFLAGRDFTVSIVGTGAESRVVGVLECLWGDPSKQDHPQGWSHNHRVASDDKTRHEVKDQGASEQSTLDGAKPAAENTEQQDADMLVTVIQDVNDWQAEAAAKTALQSWRALNCRDGGRVDLRFDSDSQQGKPFVLEVNALAGLRPMYSYWTITAEARGIDFTSLIDQIIQSAASRMSPQADK